MCGIAGVRRFDGGPVGESALRGMAQVLAHRGPDESATWSGPGLGLAHTRLSIIDLAGSHQPMVSADGRWVVVFNGEIFNYRELRSQLSYPFRTQGDTEVILAGVATEGIEFVRRLRGQFAFAMHDLDRRETHLVRDPLGVLPLYFRQTARDVVFGSEIKAILAATEGRVGPDLASLGAYLAGRSVPAPDTLFDGVRKLGPGHRAVVGDDGRMLFHEYWSAPPVDTTRRWSEAEAVDAVDRGVQEAVGAALVADVPVGAYLSGGIDSSLITAVMQRHRGVDPVDTFCAGFGDERHDELPWARLVSEHLGTRHHEVAVRATDFADLWTRLTWHRDAPVSEPADVAVFRLAELARQHVRVVLSGEGGDELFAGYPKYRFAALTEQAAKMPYPVRSGLVNALDPHLGQRAAKARIALRTVGARSEGERLRTWFAPFRASERARLLGDVTTRPLPDEAPSGVDAVDRMLRHDLRAWLPDNLLERGDRMSMAASLELRPPLLDHRLVELAFRLPSSVKVRRGTTKWVLKEVARRYLPESVVDRRKVGFRVPLDNWFRTGLRDSMWDRLTGGGSFVGQTLDRAAVRELLQRHEAGQSNEEARIWTLMSLEMWHETFFGPGAESVVRREAACESTTSS